jgi:ribosomal protein S17E
MHLRQMEGMTKRDAYLLVTKYCKTMELDFSEEQKQKMADYLCLQDKNRKNKQTTLVAEDQDLMQELAKVVQEMEEI